jgi:membrane-associated phospholipid phosphatase
VACRVHNALLKRFGATTLMPLRVATWCLAACLTWPAAAAAQTSPDLSSEAAALDVRPASSPAVQPEDAQAGATFPVPRPRFWQPLTAIPGVFVRLFSADALRVMAVGGMGALAAHQWDNAGIEAATLHFRPDVFSAGNIGGGFKVQTAASIGLYSIGALAGSHTFSSVGADLVRAQTLSQTVVQVGKLATRRARPDGSDRRSLPSGHTASAFATATVLHHHFGWRAGIPAYGFGAYVAASRMSANKHHLSDVLLGATVGIVAGRTVTVGSGATRFAMSVAPTAGGAAIMFTKR